MNSLRLIHALFILFSVTSTRTFAEQQSLSDSLDVRPDSAVATSRPGRKSCSSFKPNNTINATLQKATYYALGDTVDLHSPSGGVNSSAIPSFCRLELKIPTGSSANQYTLTEVWLPDAWDTRFVAVGNSGPGGGINYGDIAYIGVVNGHAGMSTGGDATGHFEAGAVHLSAVVAKAIVEEYYAEVAVKSYWVGCSAGGREGLEAVQNEPEDFDGVVVGSPANWLPHLDAWAIHVNLNVLPNTSAHWIPSDLWPVIHEEVLTQCDGLDGVRDGILNDPRNCSFRPEALACRPGQSPSTCLILAQIAALSKIYADYYETNQTYIFGGYEVGGELDYFNAFVGETPYPPAVEYFQNALNDPNWDYTTLNYTTIQIADALSPPSSNGMNPNITAFASAAHKGKLLHYVGWNDQLISRRNSLYYYGLVEAFVQANTELEIDDYYRLFTVPGMKHCYSGAGANAFGGAGQASQGMPPTANDAVHDVLEAMIDWVENGSAPEMLIATKYRDNDATRGVQFSRPICKFPKEIVYLGGNANVSTSFLCE